MDSSRSAQRAVIQFLSAEGEHASQIYRRIKEVYGEQCLARCTIFRWCQRYEAGRVNIKDLPRPGEAHIVTNSAKISAVDELIWQNRRIIRREIAVELLINKGTAHHIIYKKAWLWQSLGTVGAQASVRESEDGENGCLPDPWKTGSVSNPGVSTLKPSTPFLRSGNSVSMSMAIIYSCTVPHELQLEYCFPFHLAHLII
ncbi:hypothetical protein AVEN_201591-1 [Araneus ventricosus]|uniref:Mos1 transposase HTH domain-containing protein n=1 Tax=Araneus ventricosus TaxID=182803 RepID=A0A4Y2FE11_ARAVE|nr:hypothetical protein AVEN_201591-1 [Araneus ventricosus]